MAETLAWTAGSAVQSVPAIRRIGIDDLRTALRRGVDDFLATPTQLVFLCLLYPIAGLIFARAADGESLWPLIWPMSAGFALIGPFFAIGLYEISRRRERGQPASWRNAFDVLRSPAILSIAVLGFVLLAVFVLWLVAAETIFELTVGTLAIGSVGDFARAILDTPEGARLFLIGNLVGFVFAAGVLSMTVIAFPLILDRGVTPITAMRASLRAVAVNPKMMALWGMIVAAVLLLGFIPAMIGLALALPILGHATWHLYRAVVA